MKNSIIFSVLCLLLTVFSFNVNAQQNARVQFQNTCSATYDVDLNIQEVIWNADVYDWAEITGATVYQPSGNVPSAPADLPASFHAIVVDIPYDINWNIAASYRFNVSVYQYGGSVKPVMVFFTEEEGIVGGIEPITDAQGALTGFEITKPINVGGGGVVTHAVVSGKVSNEAGAGCMEVKTTNAIGTSVGGMSCYGNNDSDMQCGGGIQGRLAQNSVHTPDVNIYPNPVQDNLFIETAGLDIQDVNLLTMNGQNIDAKVSIRNGVDRLQINTTQLQPGIYLLSLKTPDEIMIKKIIVQ